jgi:iron-sulfur cluster repair protein YtfE (RIC family)
LAWKIRTGFAKNISPERIKAYTNWFYSNHLCPHFEIEEDLIFPILGNSDKLVNLALIQHKNLRQLFTKEDDIKNTLQQIEKELTNHIRFEERILFNTIQSIATKKQLNLIEEVHQSQDFEENTDDEFWK